jgi:hypothetical protein
MDRLSNLTILAFRVEIYQFMPLFMSTKIKFPEKSSQHFPLVRWYHSMRDYQSCQDVFDARIPAKLSRFILVVLKFVVSPLSSQLSQMTMTEKMRLMGVLEEQKRRLMGYTTSSTSTERPRRTRKKTNTANEYADLNAFYKRLTSKEGGDLDEMLPTGRRMPTQLTEKVLVGGVPCHPKSNIVML